LHSRKKSVKIRRIRAHPCSVHLAVDYYPRNQAQNADPYLSIDYRSPSPSFRHRHAFRALRRFGHISAPIFYNFNLIQPPAPVTLLPFSNNWLIHNRLIHPSFRLSHHSLLHDRHYLFLNLHIIFLQYL